MHGSSDAARAPSESADTLFGKKEAEEPDGWHGLQRAGVVVVTFEVQDNPTRQNLSKREGLVATASRIKRLREWDPPPPYMHGPKERRK